MSVQLMSNGFANGDMRVMHTQQQQQQQQQTAKGQQQPKALRFVTTYGAPHPKRRRIGAACLTCRKRKTACSGERPTCETCKQNKQECAGYSETATPGHKRTYSDNGPRPSFNRKDSHEDRGRQRNSPQYSIKSEKDIDPNLRHNVNRNGCPPPPLKWGLSNANGAESPGATGLGGLSRISEAQNGDEEQGQESLFSGPRNRMPYFRWLGPTAIMPGFKQMVVKVKRQETDVARSSTNGEYCRDVMSPSLNGYNQDAPSQRVPSIYAPTPATVENDVRTPLNLPFYDNSPMPPSELITHLAQTFFTHLGCNYPFLQRERFLRDLEEKQVDAILVDAVCALAARFSTHSLLTQQTHDENKVTPAEYGHTFAQRAKIALVDTFPCPSVAVVQAALLLAYNEFGESRDSGLWMYLGISIRMAQDLGMHKLEGLKYKGKSGPTPKMIKRESMSGSPELPSKLVGETTRDRVVNESAWTKVEARDQADDQKDVDEQKAVEQERVDTFWAIFFLDRVVSSGTGRRSTLRDKDIELSFPALDETDPKSGWPAVFPALIRIVHLYGRVADLLNSIKEPSDITTETPKRLASMESQVTNFYQGLSPRLHFDAVNFQHYMKAGEGTNFVLLHFWFHTLIVLLHQPTLLKTFEGRMLQLFPNSQQLSMSSAKTIADILSYSHLMDAKASLGNPFTSQPIYIAACAFLKETVEQTVTSTAQSRTSSPSRRDKSQHGSADSRPVSMHGSPLNVNRVSISELSNQINGDFPTPNGTHRSSTSITASGIDEARGSDKSEHSSLSATKAANALAKHTLLATAASQHYQLCYKALQSLETYWSGAKYILTVLNQKFDGVGDPLLYTAEEGECALEAPRPEPAFTSPGWRRKLSGEPTLPDNVGMPEVLQREFWKDKALVGVPDSPNGDPSKAIGWTLTGTMNSPSTNLAWHYPSQTSGGASLRQQPQQPRPQPRRTPSLPRFSNIASAASATSADYESPRATMQYPSHMHATSSNAQHRPALTRYPTNGSTVSTSDATDMLLGINSPYQNHRTHPAPTGSTPSASAAAFGLTQTTSEISTPHNGFVSAGTPGQGQNGHAGLGNNWNYNNEWNPNSASTQPFGDMMIESQDVDMSMLGLDMMPWFDSYPTHDFAGIFDPGNGAPAGTDHGGHRGGAGAGAGTQGPQGGGQ